MAEQTTRDTSSYPARLYRRRDSRRSKRHASNASKAPGQAVKHTRGEAVTMLKSFKTAKFDESVECCVHLGIDPRQADQQLRGALSMPKGIGKTARVICFCGVDKIDDVKAAGAIEAGGEELAKKIQVTRKTVEETPNRNRNRNSNSHSHSHSHSNSNNNNTTTTNNNNNKSNHQISSATHDHRLATRDL